MKQVNQNPDPLQLASSCICAADWQSKKTSSAISANNSTTLEEAQRKHILRALKDTNWVIGGPTGAAARLGMKRTSLHSLVKRLGITRPG